MYGLACLLRWCTNKFFLYRTMEQSGHFTDFKRGKRDDSSSPIVSDSAATLVSIAASAGEARGLPPSGGDRGASAGDWSPAEADSV